MLIIKTAEDRERCTSCYGNIIVELTMEEVVALFSGATLGDRCHYPDCRHTTDISHAVHSGAFPNGYEKVEHGDETYFVEKEN